MVKGRYRSWFAGIVTFQAMLKTEIMWQVVFVVLPPERNMRTVPVTKNGANEAEKVHWKLLLEEKM